MCAHIQTHTPVTTLGHGYCLNNISLHSLSQRSGNHNKNPEAEQTEPCQRRSSCDQHTFRSQCVPQRTRRNLVESAAFTVALFDPAFDCFLLVRCRVRAAAMTGLLDVTLQVAASAPELLSPAM